MFAVERLDKFIWRPVRNFEHVQEARDYLARALPVYHWKAQFRLIYTTVNFGRVEIPWE